VFSKTSVIARMALLVLFATGSVSQAKPLQPVKPWDLDYGDAQCSASRAYDDPAKPVLLAIIPSPDGDTFELLVAYKSQYDRFADELDGFVDFGSGPMKVPLLQYGSKDKTMTFYQFRLAADQMARAKAANTVNFHVKDARDFSFELDHVAPLLDGLQRCTADLKNYWNYDGEKSGRIAVPAKGDTRLLFSADDYPYVAERSNEEGTAQYLLLIDEKGAVAGCHVVKPSGVPALDAMGCVVIKGRAKFKPAFDPAGKPVRSTLTTPPITWRLED
jgi:TonB family protein